MVVVLVATRYQTILDWIQKLVSSQVKSIKVIKRIGPKVYLYVDTDLSFREISRELKRVIKEQGGLMYVYELYSIYNGMIDYNAYMSEETKSTMKYYQSEHKDISDMEIERFLKGE